MQTVFRITLPIVSFKTCRGDRESLRDFESNLDFALFVSDRIQHRRHVLNRDPHLDRDRRLVQGSLVLGRDLILRPETVLHRLRQIFTGDLDLGPDPDLDLGKACLAHGPEACLWRLRAALKSHRSVRGKVPDPPLIRLGVQLRLPALEKAQDLLPDLGKGQGHRLVPGKALRRHPLN